MSGGYSFFVIFIKIKKKFCTNFKKKKKNCEEQAPPPSPPSSFNASLFRCTELLYSKVSVDLGAWMRSSSSRTMVYQAVPTDDDLAYMLEQMTEKAEKLERSHRILEERVAILSEQLNTLQQQVDRLSG